MRRLPSAADLLDAGLTPHDLRHTAASLAVAAGANVKAVQRMLGHASASKMLDVCVDDLGFCTEPLDGIEPSTYAPRPSRLWTCHQLPELGVDLQTWRNKVITTCRRWPAMCSGLRVTGAVSASASPLRPCRASAPTALRAVAGAEADPSRGRLK
ncbi:tyrosine-type recombinase/integrase [Micromonospora violae]|uniref:tyrosine-type recombinase/integrase n=1 Tax=Micromonospora violae TaxID=1278207 RepID=UPI003F4CBAF3